MTNYVIAPSILSANLLALQTDLNQAIAAGADMFHIDLMDGSFVPHLTFGPDMVQAIRTMTDLPLDVHLMVQHPGNYFDQLLQIPNCLLNIHVESTVHIYSLVQQVKAAGLKAGIVLNPGTAVASVTPLLSLVDNVLVMTVNPGFGGQQFLTAMTKKLQQLQTLRHQNADYTYTLEVDGGINDQTIQLCQKAGADTFVAGSYVFDHDINQQMQNLRQALLNE